MGLDTRVIHGESGEPIPNLQLRWLDTSERKNREVGSHARITLAEGLAVTTDADGHVRLPIPADHERITLACDDQGLYGLRYSLPKDQEDVFEFKVYPSQKVQVQVSRSDGLPAEGLRVGLLAKAGEKRTNTYAVAWTDHEGTAVLQHFHLSHKTKRTTIVGVGVGLPDHQAVHTFFPKGKDLPESVSLTIPEIGYLRIEATQADGVPFPDGTEIRIQALEPPKEEEKNTFTFSLQQERVHGEFLLGYCKTRLINGTVVVPVALQQELEVGLVYPEHRDQLYEKVTGPTDPGQEVLVQLQEETPRTFLRGRFLTVEGTPVARARVEFRLVENRSVSSDSATTDTEGYFRFPLESPSLSRNSRLELTDLYRDLRYAVRTGPGVVHCGTFDLARDLTPGLTLLEDEILDAPLLTSGNTIDEEDTPLADVRLGFTIKEPMDPQGKHLRSIHLARLNTAADGSFAVFGTCDETNLTAAAEKKEYRKQEFQLENGVPDQRLRLSHGAEPFIRVLLPEGMPDDALRISYRQDHPNGNSSTSSTNLRLRDGVMILNAEEGVYDLRLELRASREEVFLAEGVEIGGKAKQDSRLDPVDLRNHFVEQVVNAHDLNGQLITDCFLRSEDAELSLYGKPRQIRSGEPFFLAQGSNEYFLWAKGFGGKEVTLNGLPQDVYLGNTHKIRLRFHGSALLKAGIHAQLSLVQADSGTSLQFKVIENQAIDLELLTEGRCDLFLWRQHDIRPENFDSRIEGLLIDGKETHSLDVSSIGAFEILDFDVTEKSNEEKDEQ
ncbi:MAG: hypothetical protein ACPG31_12200 [Planctomycetota bacterium]